MYQDATAWNFRDVGIHQGKTITEFIEDPLVLPVVVITTKSDLVIGEMVPSGNAVVDVADH